MRISTRGRYALRFMVDVARHKDDGGLVTLKAVSEREGISEKYLEQIVGALSRIGLLRSSRGPLGGYALSRDAKDYTARDILLATETDMVPVACLNPNSEKCEMKDTCSTLPLWKGLESVTTNYLNSVTLEQLANGQVPKAGCKRGVHKSVAELVGHTPLLELTNTESRLGLKARVLAKLEYLNPAGSVKDRIAKAMIDDALETGALKKDSVIIEPTSGNTGIGLAAVAASYGIRVILTMPETMSIERRNLLKAYGAEIVLTEGTKGMQGAVDKANEIAAATPGAFIPGQFTNPINPKTHEETTGSEIWEDADEKVDAFVAGVGTGGTLTGVGHYLKKVNPNVSIIAVEPDTSPLLSCGHAGAHKIQGIGANFVPEVLDTAVYNEIIKVSAEEAFSAARDFGRNEGVLVGISSGAALYAALQAASRADFEGKTVVVLLPDSADRYLSTPLFC